MISLANLAFISVERLHATFCSSKHRFVKKLVYGQFVLDKAISFPDRFLRSSRELTEPFLGAASVMSKAVIFQVSKAAKHFLHQN